MLSAFTNFEEKNYKKDSKKTLWDIIIACSRLAINWNVFQSNMGKVFRYSILAMAHSNIAFVVLFFMFMISSTMGGRGLLYDAGGNGFGGVNQDGYARGGGNGHADNVVANGGGGSRKPSENGGSGYGIGSGEETHVGPYKGKFAGAVGGGGNEYGMGGGFGTGVEVSGPYGTFSGAEGGGVGVGEHGYGSGKAGNYWGGGLVKR